MLIDMGPLVIKTLTILPYRTRTNIVESLPIPINLVAFSVWRTSQNDAKIAISLLSPIPTFLFLKDLVVTLKTLGNAKMQMLLYSETMDKARRSETPSRCWTPSTN